MLATAVSWLLLNLYPREIKESHSENNKEDRILSLYVFFFVYFILFNNNNNFTMIGLRSLNHCLAHSSEYRSGYPLGPRRGRARSCLETWYT